MTPAHFSERDVELLYLGCGSEAAATHAARCERCAGELSALRRERDALLQRSSPELYARRLVREHSRSVRTRRWLKRASSGLAIAAGALGLMLRGELDGAPPDAGMDSGRDVGRDVGVDMARSLEPRPGDGVPGDFLPKGDSAFGVIR